MTPLHIHFDHAEFERRKAGAIALMQIRGLDALLIFRQESMYYLSGYDTFGYVHFQCMVLSADGRLALLTRSADRLQAKFTSIVEDVRIWVDGTDANPADELRVLLKSYGLQGRTLGIELESYGLTAAKWLKVEAALDGFATLKDASDLVSLMRVVKSPAELAYVRRAAELADDALDAALAETRAGAFEGDILAAMQGAIYRGGGDDPANEFIIGSGAGALMCRYFTGRRHLDPSDMLTLEFAGVYRHYHAALMRTFIVGAPDPRLIDMHKAAEDALYAAEMALKPGRSIGAVFDAHASVLDAAGYRESRLNACGYSLGTTFAPNWMDWPMFYTGNPYEAQPGNVFFIHIILFDEANGLAMSLARTSIVTEIGAEPISRAGLELLVRDV